MRSVPVNGRLRAGCFRRVRILWEIGSIEKCSKLCSVKLLVRLWKEAGHEICWVRSKFRWHAGVRFVVHGPGSTVRRNADAGNLSRCCICQNDHPYNYPRPSDCEGESLCEGFRPSSDEPEAFGFRMQSGLGVHSAYWVFICCSGVKFGMEWLAFASAGMHTRVTHRTFGSTGTVRFRRKYGPAGIDTETEKVYVVGRDDSFVTVRQQLFTICW